MFVTPRIIMHPTMIKVPPVAHGGIEAKIGPKKRETMKQNDVIHAARPVRPPSAIPV
jgi:hypothetical protein